MTTIVRVSFTLMLAGLFLGRAAAHPMPDFPVRTDFKDGEMVVRLELDPRAYEAEPDETGYYMKWYYDRMTPEEKAEMTDMATPFINERVHFFFEPSGQVVPEFEWTFGMLGDKEMVELGDPMVLIGEWRPKPPAGTTGYRIAATEAGRLAVNFVNHVNGVQLERYAVLFPGEESFTLDVSSFLGGDEWRKVALIAVLSVAVLAGVIVASVVIMRRPRGA